METYSDCGGMYTNNRVNGKLVSSRGFHRFHTGELAKVAKVNVKRTRLDLHLNLAEPILLARTVGPFTLYHEAYCQVELLVEVPRVLMRDKGLEGIDRVLAPILQRYTSAEEAQKALAWNRRKREPFPEDYEETLAEHAIWKVERYNAVVQAHIDQAYEEIYRLRERLNTDLDYLAGFAEGVEEARAVDLGDCSNLLKLDLGKPRRQASRVYERQSDRQKRSDRGFRDGENLVYGLELVRSLPGCFHPLP